MHYALWVAITLTVLHLWGRETEVLLDFAASLSVIVMESAGYSRPYDGVGLGLSLVKMYVEVNDGTIDVQTSKGVGTTFTLGFPLNHRDGASSAVPL